MHRPPLMLLGICLLAGCSSLRIEHPLPAQPGDWPTFARDPMHTASTGRSPSPPLTLEWVVDVSSGVGNGSPVIVDSVLFIGNLRGELCAFSAVTGRTIGSISLGEAIQGSPVIDSGAAFIALSNSKLSVAAYDLFKGATRWKKNYGDVEVTPALYRQGLFFGNTAGTFFRADMGTGDLRWKFELPRNRTFKGIRSSPAADSGTVVFGADNGCVYALNAETGAILWQSDTGAPVTAAPLISSGRVFAGNGHGTVTAFDLPSGKILWRTDTGAPVYANAVPACDLIIVGNAAGHVTGLQRSDGARRWVTELGGPVSAGGAVADSTVYIGTLRREVFALNAENGRITWKAEAEGRIHTSPAAALGRLYIATDQHEVRCYKQDTP